LMLMPMSCNKAAECSSMRSLSSRLWSGIQPSNICRANIGHMQGMLLVDFVKVQHIHAAVSQNVGNDVRQSILTAIVMKEQAFADATPADDQVGGANSVKQTLDD